MSWEPNLGNSQVLRAVFYVLVANACLISPPHWLQTHVPPIRILVFYDVLCLLQRYYRALR